MSLSSKQANEQQISVQNNAQYNEDVKVVRHPQHAVSPIFINRWSTRAFEPYQLTTEELNTIIEAASYAPSANNFQPWRFFVASTKEQKELFLQFLMPRNADWAQNASALVLVAGETALEDGKVNGTQAFDSGAAWATMAYQAKMLGLSTRAMGGFERDKAKELLHMSESLVPHVVVAIGKPGSNEYLDESFHKFNNPTPRKSLNELIIPFEVK